jgi:hypothetical protein
VTPRAMNLGGIQDTPMGRRAIAPDRGRLRKPLSSVGAPRHPGLPLGRRGNHSAAPSEAARTAGGRRGRARNPPPSGSACPARGDIAAPGVGVDLEAGGRPTATPGPGGTPPLRRRPAPALP